MYLFLGLLFPIVVFATGNKESCPGKLEPVKTVLVRQAESAPTIKQCFGTCYFEVAAGTIQDELTSQQLDNKVPHQQLLYLARTSLMAHLLWERVSRLEQSMREGKKLDTDDVLLVEAGNPQDLLYSFKGLDIPLFQFSFRGHNDGPLNLIKGTQGITALGILKQQAPKDITSSARINLENALNKEFNHEYNSGKFFRVIDINSKIIFYDKAGEANKSLTVFPEDSVFKEYVNSSIPLITFQRFEDANHVVRIYGYKEDINGKITDVILEDSQGNADNDHGGLERGRRTITYEQFKSTTFGVLRIFVKGQIIDKSEAKIRPLQ